MVNIKKHFNFGPYKTRRIGRIFFKKSSTNLFITLTDFDNKVIICRSSGCVIASKIREGKYLHKLLKILCVV